MAKIPRVKPTTYTGPGVSPPMTGYKKSSTKRSRYRSKQALTNESDTAGRLFCAALASSIISEDNDDDVCVSVSESEYCREEYDTPIVEVPYNYQYSLNLETIEDREEELQRMIRKTENLYESLGMYALRWHYLMQDVENNPGIESMFDNLQLLRKLSGGTVF